MISGGKPVRCELFGGHVSTDFVEEARLWWENVTRALGEAEMRDGERAGGVSAPGCGHPEVWLTSTFPAVQLAESTNSPFML